MPTRVGAGAQRIGEIDCRQDARCWLGQVGIERDARVEHRHRHAFARPPRAPGSIGVDGSRVGRSQRAGERRVGLRSHRGVAVDVCHPGCGTHSAYGRGSCQARGAVDERQRHLRGTVELQQIQSLLSQLNVRSRRWQRTALHLHDHR